ncbi:SNF2 family N-terminal domain-containing protein [Armillaria luteobubalina]|uniref:Chromatin-remodeling ATPase INO80 n=1 Tax=Armillaria luteobubalina TaxID=153913 RepID=A0AA39QD46_9AGAR|nr:SNF2 family N-terminal domain-containing protein [Armillaria luteobubalina]
MGRVGTDGDRLVEAMEVMLVLVDSVMALPPPPLLPQQPQPGPQYMPMPPGPICVDLPQEFKTILAILRENRLAQLATNEIRVIARVEQLGNENRGLRSGGRPPSDGSSGSGTSAAPVEPATQQPTIIINSPPQQLRMPMVPMGPPGTMPHMVPMPPMSTGIPIPQPTVFVQPESRSSSESYSSPRSARSRRSQSGSPRSGRSRSRTRSRRSRSPSRSLMPPPPVMVVSRSPRSRSSRSRGPHAMQPIIVPGAAPLPVLGQPFPPTAPVITLPTRYSPPGTQYIPVPESHAPSIAGDAIPSVSYSRPSLPAPTNSTVIFELDEEITRFVPRLKVLPYWGNIVLLFESSGVRKNKLQSGRAVSRSHYQLSADQQYFQRVKWQYIISDEAQNIKNSSRTLIQNSMQELWALLHFIMPSLFNSHDEFNEWFSKDIKNAAENKGSKLNEHQLRRLHMILKPFMLRRVKKHVQNELSEKIEEDIYVSLSARRRSLYKALLAKVSVADLIAKAANIGDTNSATKLLYRYGGVLDVPSDASYPASWSSCLTKLMNIWSTDWIRRSIYNGKLLTSFAFLSLLAMSPQEVHTLHVSPLRDLHVFIPALVIDEALYLPLSSPLCTVTAFPRFERGISIHVGILIHVLSDFSGTESVKLFTEVNVDALPIYFKMFDSYTYNAYGNHPEPSPCTRDILVPDSFDVLCSTNDPPPYSELPTSWTYNKPFTMPKKNSTSRYAASGSSSTRN